MNKSTKNRTARGDSRREFLKKSTLAGAALALARKSFITPVYGQNQAPSPGRVIGANDRIVVGYIGVGLQGTAHVGLQKTAAQQNNIVQAAVCDLSKTRRDETKEKLLEGKCDVYEHYEDLLAKKDIDAVTIATCDQWHATAAIAALDAGKHVYLEKPMARYLGEAFDLYDKVKATGLIFQVGSQACSDAKWAKARDLVAAGKIGKLVLGQESYMRNSKHGEWNDPPYTPAGWMTAQDLDWVRWQGKVAHKVAFDPERYVRWRKFYPYCAGPLGDLAPHRIHPLLLASANPEFPSRVVCLGQNPVHADKDAQNAAERDCPEDVQIVAEFPGGSALLMITGTVNQIGLDSTIRGHKGTLHIGADSVKFDPEAAFSDDDDMDPASFASLRPTEAIEVHEKNWFDCIRSKGVTNANEDLAIKAQTVLSLAEMSNRLNMMCLFDGKTRKITDGNGKEITAITYGTLEKS